MSFDALLDDAERRLFEGIPTTLDLPGAETRRLREVARRILIESGEFQRLVHDLELP